MKTPETALRPNQVVAYNLRAARVLRGWTQEEAAEYLEESLGERWSEAVFSVAESGRIPGRRARLFNADQIAAFAKTFEVPVSFFFLPPPGPDWDPLLPVTNETLEMLDLAVGAKGSDFVAQRIDDILMNLPPELSEQRERLEEYRADREVAALVQSLGDLPHWIQVLREVAARLSAAQNLLERRQQSSASAEEREGQES